MKLKPGEIPIFGINKYEAHDRLLELKKNTNDIGECCQDLINQRPFGDHPFYIFAHARTQDDGATKRLIWQPRLTKPRAELNSMLFRVKAGSDKIEIVWILPPPETIDQFSEGKVTQSDIVSYSVEMFKTRKSELEAPDPGDLPDKKIDEIYRDISLQYQSNKKQVII